MNNPRGTKRQRERDRQERAERKRQRRVDRAEADAAAPEADAPAPEQQVLDDLAALHAQYADGDMALEDFEAARSELTSRLRVD